MNAFLKASGLAISLAIASTAVMAAGETATPPRQKWSFSGMTGTFDNNQLQRGFQVYQQVCSACHTMTKVAFRNLSEKGGPEFKPEQIRELAAKWPIQVMDGPNDKGEMFERPARPSDRFPSPFANPVAHRLATNGALPPDFSLLAKARTYRVGFPGFVIDALPGFTYQESGVDYIYALLALGYVDPPHGMVIEDGLNFNTFMPGQKIAMANPLADGVVEYTDGSPMTKEQYAKDVTAFMMWAAEPKLEERKQLGFRVMIFLLVFASLLYFTKKKIWADVKGKGGAAAEAH
jgi:cytochrome c1